MSVIVGTAALVRITNVARDPGVPEPGSQIPASEKNSVRSGRSQQGSFRPSSARHFEPAVHRNDAAPHSERFSKARLLVHRLGTRVDEPPRARLVHCPLRDTSPALLGQHPFLPHWAHRREFLARRAVVVGREIGVRVACPANIRLRFLRSNRKPAEGGFIGVCDTGTRPPICRSDTC